MPDSNNCFWHLSAVANFTTRHGFCSILEKNTAFCVYSVHVKYWCATNSNLAYFTELTTALECQKQLLMSSISNLGGRESLEIAVTSLDKSKTEYIWVFVSLLATIFGAIMLRPPPSTEPLTGKQLSQQVQRRAKFIHHFILLPSNSTSIG